MNQGIVERLATAINAHDLEALVACFADDVESVQPAHPARGFRGSDQIRRNWTQIFAAVPDLRATVVRAASIEDETFSEWHWRGTRNDGSTFEMRGVTVQQLVGDRIGRVRFYMEPVEAKSRIEEAVNDVVGR